MSLHTTVLRIVQEGQSTIVDGKHVTTNTPTRSVACHHEPYDRFITLTLEGKTLYGLGFTHNVGKQTSTMLLVSNDLNNISDFVSDINEQTPERKVCFAPSIIHYLAHQTILLPVPTVEQLVESNNIVLAVMNPKELTASKVNLHAP